MQEKAFQDFYPDEFSHCYGCGRLNEHGHKIKSVWDGEESVAFFTPDGRYMALPGFVYGGLIASLIDCHSTGTAHGFGTGPQVCDGIPEGGLSCPHPFRNRALNPGPGIGNKREKSGGGIQGPGRENPLRQRNRGGCPDAARHDAQINPH